MDLTGFDGLELTSENIQVIQSKFLYNIWAFVRILECTVVVVTSILSLAIVTAWAPIYQCDIVSVNVNVNLESA